MFALSFLFRLAQFALALILAGLILYGFVWLINRGVQWLGAQLGYEVGDFFGWLKELLPRRKKRNTKA